MKKIIVPVVAVIGLATLAFAGENFFHTIKAEMGAFASRLAVGATEPNPSYALDVVGAARVTGVPTIVGAPVITGSPAITGNPAVIGYVAVSSASTSSNYICMKGAYVTVPTAGTEGCLAYQLSDHKLYVATATGNGVWVATH